MHKFKKNLLVGVASMLLTQPALAAQDDSATVPEASRSTGLNDIVVTARRQEERLQDVPVAVSVLTPEALEANGTFNPVDLVQSVPGLSVTATVADRNNLTYTIRGQGFAYGTLFPAVITYFNEVPIARLTQGQFFDLANVQVLRGPQGVSFGRVTTGGNVMVTPQLPKEDFGGYVTGKLGNYGLRTFNGAINVPIVEDKVLARVAFETSRRSGFTTNVFNGQKLDDVKYESFRGGLTLRPAEGLENTTVVSYQRTHDNGTSMIFADFNPAASGLTPAVGQFSFLFAGGYGIDSNGSVLPFRAGLTPYSAPAYAASLQSQLDAQNARGVREVSLVDPIYSERKNLYIVNTTTLDISDNIQIKNVFGYVREREDQASNFAAVNGAAVLTCHSACPGNPGLLFTNTEQFSEELRISGKALDNRLDFSLGAYFDKQQPAGRSENATISLGMLNRVTPNYVTTKSRAVYGTLEYAITDNLSVNGGLRYTHDTVHSEQNTYLRPIDGGQIALFNFLTGPFGGSLPANIANQVVEATFAPIPHGECVSYGAGSVLYANGARDCTVTDGKFNATTWTAGATYKTDAGQLFYAKVSKGYRPGGVNASAPAGLDPAYAPETDLSVEVGMKADFRFDDVLVRANLAAYTDRYKDIQKNVVLPGPVPVSSIQNVNDARIKGIEAELMLSPVEGMTFSGTFAYTDAKFDDQIPVVVGNPCDPTQTTTIGFCSDNRFNGVPKFQYTLRFDYKLPIDPSIGDLSVGGMLYHQSSVALTDTSMLNPESIEKPYTTVDLNLNLKNVGGQPVDLGLFVTNVTDEVYRIGNNNLMQNSSVGVLGNIYAPPRMWGASLKYRFGADAY